MAKDYLDDFKSFIEGYDKALAAQEDAHSRYLRMQTEDNQRAWNAIYEHVKKRVDDTLEARKQADKIYETYRENSVKRMNAYEYEAYRKKLKSQLEDDAEYIRDRMEMEIAAANTEYANEKERDEKIAEIRKAAFAAELQDETQRFGLELNKHRELYERSMREREQIHSTTTEALEKREKDSKKREAKLNEDLQKSKDRINSGKLSDKELEKEKKKKELIEKRLKTEEEEQKKINKLREEGANIEADAAKKRHDTAMQEKQNERQERDERNSHITIGGQQIDTSFMFEGGQFTGFSGMDAEDFKGLMDDLGKAMDSLVNNAATTLASVETKVNTRLRGYNPQRTRSGANVAGAVVEAVLSGGLSLGGGGLLDEVLGKETSPFRQMYDIIKYNVGMSPLVKQTDVLNNLAELTKQGIAYNVESRAYLQTLSQGIADTFSAMQESMLRIIRIQQQDSTMERLGMEAKLTQLFNKHFQDTSYLTQTFDNVANSLLEASSKLTRDASVEFEFMVQKWLGALQSVGTSSTFVQNVAQAIGWLGSGDVTSLAGNVPMQTLLAISANRAGLNYAELLTKGLNASNVNQLLTAMVSYLGDIADNTDMNNVVQKAYGGVLGLNVSDFQSIQNLIPQVVELSSAAMSSQDMRTMVNESIATMFTRMSVSTMLNNIMANAEFAIGASTAANPFTYTTYRAMGILDDLAGGLELPYVSWLGTGIDLHSIVSMVKAGLGGLGVLSAFVQAMTGLASFGVGAATGNPLAAWNYRDTLVYGTGSFGKMAGSAKSQTQIVGNTSTQDVEEGAIKESMKQSEETQKISGAEQMQEEKDIYTALINEGDKAVVSNMKVSIDDTNTQIQQLNSLQTSMAMSSNKNAQNVNLKYINGREVAAGGIPISFDTVDLVKELVRRLGYETEEYSTGGWDLRDGQTTMAEAAKAIVDSKNEDNGSINVTVTEMEQSMLGWLQDSKSKI